MTPIIKFILSIALASGFIGLLKVSLRSSPRRDPELGIHIRNLFVNRDKRVK